MALKLVMTAVTGFGLALSLGAQMLAAYLFGAGGEMDAYFAGVALPMFIVLVANEMALLYAVPQLHRTLRERGPSAVAALQARLLIAGGLIWAAVAVLGIAMNAAIVATLFPGIEADAARLAAHVMAIQFIAVPFSTGAALLLQMRFLRGAYALPYLVFLLSPLFVIGSGLAFHAELGAASLAVGSAGGAVVQFCLLFALGRAWSLPARRALAGRIAWSFSSSALLLACAVVPVHVVPLVDRHFASALGEGAVAAIAYSWFFTMAATALVFRGWSMPVFHAMAGDAADAVQRFRDRIAHSTRELLMLAAAMVVILQLAGPTIIRLLLHRGAFALDDAELVAGVFRYHSVAVPGLVLFMLFVRACCAMTAYRPAATLGVLSCLAYAALAAAFVPAGPLGLAQASAATWSLIGLCALAYMTRARWLAGPGAFAS